MLTPAGHADDTAIKEEIIDLFHQVVNAIERHDAKGAMQLYAPGYVDKTPGAKQQTMAEREKELRDVFKSLKAIYRADMDIDKLVVRGAEAVARGTVVVEFDMVDNRGTFGKKGLPHILSATSYPLDTYVKMGGKWRLKESNQHAAEKLVVDGKPFIPPAPKKPAK